MCPKMIFSKFGTRDALDEIRGGWRAVSGLFPAPFPQASSNASIGKKNSGKKIKN